MMTAIRHVEFASPADETQERLETADLISSYAIVQEALASFTSHVKMRIA